MQLTVNLHAVEIHTHTHTRPHSQHRITGACINTWFLYTHINVKALIARIDMNAKMKCLFQSFGGSVDKHLIRIVHDPLVKE